MYDERPASSFLPRLRSHRVLGDRDKQMAALGLQGERVRCFSTITSHHMADLSAFSPLPDNARLWIYATAAPLDDATQSALLDRLSTFIDGWTSHEHPVEGAATVLHNRFLVIAATPKGGGDISGCGIDDLTRTVDNAASALSIDWVPSLDVLYRSSEGTVTAVSRRAFQERANDGSVTPETPVFDPSLTTLDALRAGAFEIPARESWHAQLLITPAGA